MLHHFHCYHLKLTIKKKKKISYSLWQPPTLNDYLTTYMSGQTTQQHRSCSKPSRGSYWLVVELLFLGTQICVFGDVHVEILCLNVCKDIHYSHIFFFACLLVSCMCFWLFISDDATRIYELEMIHFMLSMYLSSWW